MNNPLAYIDPLGLWAVGYNIIYEKNKDGTDNLDKIKRVEVYLVQEEGDNAESLAKALNISQKDADKIFGKMSDGLIRGKDAGGRIGFVFDAIEGYLKDWIGDVVKHGSSGDTNYRKGQDCSSTAAGICFGRFKGIQGTPTLDEILGATQGGQRLNAVALNNESQLRTGDIVRYDTDDKRPADHFATFLFFNRSGVPMVFSKSGMKGPFEFGTVPDIGQNNGYGAVKPLPDTKDKTGYYRKQQ